MNEYPYESDQFDREADQVGAHGAHRVEEPFWKQNLTALLIALAALVGIIALLWFMSTLGQDRAEAPAPAPSESVSAPAASDNGGAPAVEETQEAAAEPNKEAPVLVLNGAGVSGLAASWKSALEDHGWTGVEIGDGRRTNTGGVYYKREEDKATAERLAVYLGVEATQSQDYQSNITVVVVERPGDLAALDSEG